MRWGTRPGPRGGWGPGPSTSTSHSQAGNEGLGRAPTWGQPELARLPATPRPRGNHCAVFWSTRSYPVVSNSGCYWAPVRSLPAVRAVIHSALFSASGD